MWISPAAFWVTSSGSEMLAQGDAHKIQYFLETVEDCAFLQRGNKLVKWEPTQIWGGKLCEKWKKLTLMRSSEQGFNLGSHDIIGLCQTLWKEDQG